MVTPTELPSMERTAELLRDCPEVELLLGPHEAFALIALLKLALRHPEIQGPIADVALEAIKAMKAGLPREVYPVIDYGIY